MAEQTSITVLEDNNFWSVQVIEQPEGDWIVTNFHGIRAEERARQYASQFLKEKYRHYSSFQRQEPKSPPLPV